MESCAKLATPSSGRGNGKRGGCAELEPSVQNGKTTENCRMPPESALAPWLALLKNYLSAGNSQY